MWEDGRILGQDIQTQNVQQVEHNEQEKERKCYRKQKLSMGYASVVLKGLHQCILVIEGWFAVIM